MIVAHFNSTSLYKKSGKTNEQIFHKVQKTLFLGIFGPKLAQKNFFFENRAPSHFGHHHFAPLCQKSEKQMSRSRQKLVKDERTNERTNERKDTGQFKGPPGRSKKKD